jgi:hypothetical protein
MAYAVETITTKPEGAQWFNLAHPEIYKEIYNVYQTHRDSYGLLAVTLKLIDSNTAVQTQIFLDETSSRNWSEFTLTQVPHQTRYQYNIENNITWTVRSYNV